MRLVGGTVGKPNKTIHASGVTCAGDEQTLTDCTLTTYPLEQGKMMASSVDVAGVSCQVYSPCAKVPVFDESNNCINDSIRLSGGAMSTEGRLELLSGIMDTFVLGSKVGRHDWEHISMTA